MSIPQQINDINKKLDELMEFVNTIQLEKTKDINLETFSNNIIEKITSVIKDCPCNKEIIDTINKRPEQSKEMVVLEETSKKPTGLSKYTYPNFQVGNEELGKSKNPNSLKWSEGFK